MLKSLSIKFKLQLILVLPLLSMIYFSYFEIKDKYDKKVDAERIEKINILNEKIASFIHELQKERGMTATFLYSKRIIYKNRINEQVKLTDRKYKVLNDYLFNHPDNNLKIFDKTLKNFYNGVLEVRKKVLRKDIEIKDFVIYYSSNINILLDYIYNTAEISKKIELSRMMLSYGNFLFLKEKTAIERILFSNIILKKKLESKDILALHKLIVLRNENENFFLKLMDNEDIKQIYRKSIKSYNNIKVKSVEKKVIKYTRVPSINVKKWFDLISEIINEQDAISKKIALNIIKQSSEIKNEMINNVKLGILYIIVIVLLLFFLVLVIYNSINGEIKTILSGISFISNNELEQYKDIHIESNDELKKLANVFNNMVFELKERDKEAKVITEKLNNAKILAEKNNKEKSDFLANMSHEIRTPLNAIVGFINLLKENEIDMKKLEYLNIVDSSSNNLLEIINDILDFSKIENSKIILEEKDVNIYDELHLIRKLFKTKIEEKQINFTMEIDPKLPTFIYMDITKLRQVLINLIGNAIKFTKYNKTVEVNIEYNLDILYVTVFDQGIGIDKDKLHLIFEPFKQADSSTTREYGGTGLGLTISSRFVTAMGGTLKVKSVLGEGSTFLFHLPIATSNNMVNNCESDVTKNTFIGHILLVEDNKSNQIFMKVILKKLHLTFDIANDGVEAVEYYRNNKYDLILMDENMPRLSGIEATKRIIEIEKDNNLKHTSIIALTANALVGDRERFLKAGMDDYLSKPLNQDSLKEVLNKFLQSKRKKCV